MTARGLWTGGDKGQGSPEREVISFPKGAALSSAYYLRWEGDRSPEPIACRQREATQPARRVSRTPEQVGSRFPPLLQSVSQSHIFPISSAH